MRKGLKAKVLFIGALVVGTVHSLAAAVEHSCSESTTLSVKTVEPPEQGGVVWTWEIGIENSACAVSAGAYQYDLVYKLPNGDEVRDPRSGEGWSATDSRQRKVKTRESLPKGARDARLEKLSVTSCDCV